MGSVTGGWTRTAKRREEEARIGEVGKGVVDLIVRRHFVFVKDKDAVGKGSDDVRMRRSWVNA